MICRLQQEREHQYEHLDVPHLSFHMSAQTFFTWKLIIVRMNLFSDNGTGHAQIC